MAPPTSTTSSSMAATPCREIEHDDNVLYQFEPVPWALEMQKHANTPPLPCEANWCYCMWSHVPSHRLVQAHGGPKMEWTHDDDLSLAVVWFHSQLHVEKGGTWTRNNYHEALSLLIGHRVLQSDIFDRIKVLRSTLPAVWLEGCQLGDDSPKVVEIYHHLNMRWVSYVNDFELWKGYADISVWKPVLQKSKVEDLYEDVCKYLVDTEDKQQLGNWLDWFTTVRDL